jgi:hypothetical protein
MNRFSRDLDNYITGHYGEDQFPKCENCHRHDQEQIAFKNGLYIYVCKGCAPKLRIDGYKIKNLPEGE